MTAAAARGPDRGQGLPRRGRRADHARHRVHRRACRAGLGAGQAAARRGRDRDRQDEPARARVRAVHRVGHLGRDPEPLGPRPGPRRILRRQRRRRSPRASPPPRLRPTAPARSAIRPPTARCSGSSHSEAGCRSTRGSSAWQGMSVNGFLTRTVLDTALLLDAATTGADRAEGPAPQGSFAKRPPRAGEASDRRVAEGHAGYRPADARPSLPRSRRGDRRAPRLARPSGDLAETPIGARVGNGVAILYLAASRTTRACCPTASVSVGRSAGLARLGSLVPRLAARAHQGRDPEARSADQRDLRRRRRACCCR